MVSPRGRIGGASGCPTVSAGIISRTSVQKARVKSAPDDDFTAGPDCRVTKSASGALIRLVGVQVLSVHTSGLEISGRAYVALPNVVMLNLLPIAWVRSNAKRWSLSLTDNSATKRSVNTAWPGTQR